MLTLNINEGEQLAIYHKLKSDSDFIFKTDGIHKIYVTLSNTGVEKLFRVTHPMQYQEYIKLNKTGSTKQNIKTAMKTLKAKLMSDHEYHRTWVDNISIKIQDNCDVGKNEADIAANDFLDHLMFYK